MQGTYKITIGDNTYKYKNIITNDGKLTLLNTIGGKRKGWANAIVVGIGSSAATVDDTALNFAVSGADTSMSIVDYVNEKVYFKASLPVNDNYTVYELGCHAGNIASAQRSSQTGGSLLAVFTTSVSLWTDVQGTSVSDTTNNRIGEDSISYSILAAGTAQGFMNLTNDFSQLPADTKFNFAYHCSNLADLILRFKVDDANYYESDAYSVANGYNISSVSKSAFVATGSPTWTDIRFFEIEATATGSPGSISIDALRYDLIGQTGEGLLSRVVITPDAKLIGVTMDVEYVLELDL
jgi:hypothetical protein